MHRTTILLLFGFFLLAPSFAGAAAIVADHEACAFLESIPDSCFTNIRAQHKIFYGHTSHGSQIMSGLALLEGADTLYAAPAFSEYNDDLGHLGDLSWVAPTRNFLDAHPDFNMVMWSWCGGASDNTEEGINIYLNAMDALEADYPSVIFVYMTGHLDGTGPSGNLYVRNNQIRDYCLLNDKVLFDFADIESWDPDENYYPGETDTCAWCYVWCASHSCPSCYCAHSHCFNCYQKGRAWWWMMATLDGWSEATGVAAEGGEGAPPAFGLRQNRPNPFNPVTEIRFLLGSSGPARLDIFDPAGRLVQTLLNEPLPVGDHGVLWRGEDRDGRPAPAGIYFYRLRTPGFTDTKKMILIR